MVVEVAGVLDEKSEKIPVDIGVTKLDFEAEPAEEPQNGKVSMPLRDKLIKPVAHEWQVKISMHKYRVLRSRTLLTDWSQLFWNSRIFKSILTQQSNLFVFSLIRFSSLASIIL